MVFWRKKKNDKQNEEEIRDDHLIHPDNEPDLTPPLKDTAESDEELKRQPEEVVQTPPSEAPHVQEEDPEASEASKTNKEDEQDDSEEGGWFSRLTSGLSKSSNKITQGLTDLITKKKLDQDALDELEEVLITADLGPQTAAKVIEYFAKDRFGKDISEEEIREALALSIEKILAPVAKPIQIHKPENGPFVIVVCGVNGAGKTTSIGKLAHQLHYNQKLKVMMAAGDTFRAAAVEQLQEWARRVGCVCHTKDVGADAASVAYEAYEQAKAENVDVLLIDTAGRLQNKKNLMEELQKLLRVLGKQDETVPHATL